MKKLIFATQNTNKLIEIKSAVNSFKVVGLKEMDIHEDIPETGASFKENALIKAKFVFDKTGLSCFSDDTGLEIEALDNRPGIFSARYAGPSCSSEENIQKVLKELKNIRNRKARFKTVIALILNGKEFFFEGKIVGKILKDKKGIGGFGYDSIFKPEGHRDTFAEMSLDFKNKISHRGIAIKKLISFLNYKNLES